MAQGMTMAARVQVAASVANGDWWAAEDYLRLEDKRDTIYFTAPKGYTLEPGDHGRLYIDGSLLVVKDGKGVAYNSKNGYLAVAGLDIVDDEETGYWMFTAA